jgi:adenylate kinase
LLYLQGEEFEKEICPCTKILYFDVSDETMTARLINRGKSSGEIYWVIQNVRITG